ncbi:MAG: DUF2892 domain-containing protein [Oligoflexia bacterium]|nr:DUF2892 domain-containing protein [Oligoflexia bacterium]
MKREYIVRAVAGSLVLISSILGYILSPYWLFITMFVGLNLLQSSFTAFCPLEMFLKKYTIGKE